MTIVVSTNVILLFYLRLVSLFLKFSQQVALVFVIHRLHQPFNLFDPQANIPKIFYLNHQFSLEEHELALFALAHNHLQYP
jgi:hypothetical protein